MTIVTVQFWELLKDSSITELDTPVGDESLLVLPSEEQPMLTVYEDFGGQWTAEGVDGSQRVGRRPRGPRQVRAGLRVLLDRIGFARAD